MEPNSQKQTAQLATVVIPEGNVSSSVFGEEKPDDTPLNIHVLMMTHILGYLPPVRHHARICSAGSKGYCAVKEMLQNCVAGNIIMLESDDLHNVRTSIGECCFIFKLPAQHPTVRKPSKFTRSKTSVVGRVTVYTNNQCIPPSLLDKAQIVSINLSPLTNVTEIQKHFLARCIKLTTLDVSPLSGVKEVHEGFLLECTGLAVLDLSPLSLLKKVHRNFLSGCTGLTTLLLPPLEVIHDGFLTRCTGLSTLDLSPLSQLKEVNPGFLAECCKLVSLDLSPLSQVVEIWGGFLVGCTGLTMLDLSPLSQLTTIHDLFLERCTGLTELDLSPLSRVKCIRKYFLSECTGLTNIDLNPLSQVTEIINGFLIGCSGLTSLDMSPLTQVTKVHPLYFLWLCPNLNTVKYAPPLCGSDPPNGWAYSGGYKKEWTRI